MASKRLIVIKSGALVKYYLDLTFSNYNPKADKFNT